VSFLNQLPGLARGPLDHKSSSVINMISNGAIDMGSSVALSSAIIGDETLPRVEETSSEGAQLYGIVVGGDADGIYGDGSASTDDSTRATNGAGQGVVVVTQGRCLARIRANGAILPISGEHLSQSTISGVLEVITGSPVIAMSLAAIDVNPEMTNIAIVDVQRASPTT